MTRDCSGVVVVGGGHPGTRWKEGRPHSKGERDRNPGGLPGFRLRAGWGRSPSLRQGQAGGRRCAWARDVGASGQLDAGGGVHERKAWMWEVWALWGELELDTPSRPARHPSRQQPLLCLPSSTSGLLSPLPRSTPAPRLLGTVTSQPTPSPSLSQVPWAGCQAPGRRGGCGSRPPGAGAAAGRG